MTEIRYDADALRLEISGHAGAGEYGNDIVCAAESILTMALMERAEERAELFLPAIASADGYTAVECIADEENTTLCREMLETVLTGFMLLAEHYPENVRVTVCADDEERGERT